MKLLTGEIKNLLDKLYNLRGDDSVVLIKMEEEKVKAENTKTKTTELKKDLQEKIESLTKEEATLAEEGEKLKNALSTIKTDDFKTVLGKLNIDFNPDKISQRVSETLPTTIDKVVSEAKKAKEELVSVEEEMNQAISTIEELGIRRNEAIANQKRLNEYFELALDGNINITRDSITSLLKEFEFNEDEQREAAKLLMFPEDALFEYDKKYKDSQATGKSITEVLEEAKVVSENKKMSPKEELIELLKEFKFDYLEFTNNDLAKILANYDEDTLRENVTYVKDKGLDKGIFVDNIELLYDKDLKSKIDKLIEIGKEPMDVYLNPRVLIKYNKEDLNTAIDKMINGGLDPKIVPLIAY
jgi:hypothetical protein